VEISVSSNVKQAGITLGEADRILILLTRKALGKLKEYNINFEDREAAYQCFDRCCFPKILKGAYEIERIKRGKAKVGPLRQGCFPNI
jgi:hypothetical protein